MNPLACAHMPRPASRQRTAWLGGSAKTCGIPFAPVLGPKAVDVRARAGAESSACGRHQEPSCRVGERATQPRHGGAQGAARAIRPPRLGRHRDPGPSGLDALLAGQAQPRTQSPRVRALCAKDQRGGNRHGAVVLRCGARAVRCRMTMPDAATNRPAPEGGSALGSTELEPMRGWVERTIEAHVECRDSSSAEAFARTLSSGTGRAAGRPTGTDGRCGDRTAAPCSSSAGVGRPAGSASSSSSTRLKPRPCAASSTPPPAGSAAAGPSLRS